MSTIAEIARDSDVQDHDRFSTKPLSSIRGAMVSGGDAPEEPVEITVAQKMLSATTGSLLTGLLGES
jgi:hypothetical protein